MFLAKLSEEAMGPEATEQSRESYFSETFLSGRIKQRSSQDLSQVTVRESGHLPLVLLVLPYRVPSGLASWSHTHGAAAAGGSSQRSSSGSQQRQRPPPGPGRGAPTHPKVTNCRAFR